MNRLDGFLSTSNPPQNNSTSSASAPVIEHEPPKEKPSGYMSFPDDNPDKETLADVVLADREVKKQERRKFWVQACYISIGAILGVAVRIVIAQLFGEECKNPGTVGWLSSGAPLCVTANGVTLQEGGIIFADLPSNLLGSFLMGFVQDWVVLHLAVPMALAWLPPEHPLQRMSILHNAFKTGFCGSLTTFSSWNSEMVVLIFGTGSSNRSTQVWSALFGYIIGMETAIGSFACGKSVARWLHHVVNPMLAAEAHAAEERRAEGVYVHSELPAFERRYLPKLDMGDTYGDLLPLGRVDDLERWRLSTESARRIHHPMLPLLIDIEIAALISEKPIPREAESMAIAEGWDVESLQLWVQAKAGDANRLPSLSSISVTPDGRPPEESKWFSPLVSALLAGSLMSVLVALLLLLSPEEATIVTYRTMVFSMLLGPTGALARWRLSKLNGTHSKFWWFPYGTFLANVIGSVISITAVATEYHLESKYGASYGNGMFWSIGTIRAIRVGFSASLTTVSTFVAEVSGFMQKHKDYYAYPYTLATLLTAAVLSIIIYAIIVYAI